jgi:hypothetical protein
MNTGRIQFNPSGLAVPLGPRILSGPDTVKAAQKLARKETNKELFPYDWVYPSKNAIRVTGSDKGIQSIPAPAPATPTIVVQYTVPTGFRFILTGILRWTNAAGFIQGSGNALWTMDINEGSYIAQGLAGAFNAGISSSSITMGSPDVGAWNIGFPQSMPGVFKSLEVLRDLITTTADITAGAPNYFIGGFFGWLEPAED